MHTGTQWLTVVLDSPPKFALSSDAPSREILLAGERFVDWADDALAAFFDCIRDANGYLVGFKIWPTDPHLSVIEHMSSGGDLVRIDHGEGSIEVRFDRTRTAASSFGDQAFGGRLYSSLRGAVAVSIDLGYLLKTEQELARVRTADVDWISWVGSAER